MKTVILSGGHGTCIQEETSHKSKPMIEIGNVAGYAYPAEDWTIHLTDTGDGTGGRIRKRRDWIGNDTFMLTYGDGVADVDLGKLVAFHNAHGKLATVTAVRPRGQAHLDTSSRVEA